MGFYLANGMGDSIDCPSPEQMTAFLKALDRNDEEHGAAWLSNDKEHSLEWHVDGRLVFDHPELATARHLRTESHARVVELWRALAAGDLALLEAEPWQPGNGFVLTPEREVQRAS